MASGVSVSWRSLVLGKGAGSAYAVKDIQGWDSLPAYASANIPVQGGHGALPAPIRFDQRVVTVSGFAFSTTARDVLLLALRAGTAPGRNTLTTELLTIDLAGLVLSADARVVRADAEDKAGWAVGRFAFIVQWLCSDPLRYGSWSVSSCPIAGTTTGITFPVTPPWVFPAAPPSGQIVLNNPGTAYAQAVYTLNGPLNNIGLDVGGRRVTYGFNLALGDSLAIDTKLGSASFNGAYRSPMAGSARTAELLVTPGASTVQALGNPGSGGVPWVTASFRPAYW